MGRAALAAALLAIASLVAVDVSAAWLVDAIRDGNRTTALALLDDGADPNAASDDGTTALHWAVANGDAELVARLVAAGADPNVANVYGATPMAEAAVSAGTEIIEALLEAGADPDAESEDGQTSLMLVARTANVGAARLLLEHGANVNARERLFGQTALMWAASQRRPQMVALLLEHGAEVDARSRIHDWERQVSGEPRAQYRPSGGLTPMLFAVREGCLDCVRLLLDAGADIDLPDPDGITPLIMAVANMRFDIAAFLLDAGADPNRWDWWGRTPLYLAVDLNTLPHGGRPDRPVLDATTSLELIERLLAAGANPNAQLKLRPPFRNVGADRGVDHMLIIGTTPLLRAAKAGDVAAIELLLAHGADPTLTNRDGINPLMAAAGLGTAEQDTTGRYKTEAQAIESIRLLMEAGLDVNATDRRGRTALHGAALQGYNEVVRYLASVGARLDVEDGSGYTPLDTALGLAGGFGFSGREGVVRPDTAAVIRELLAQRGERR